MSVTLTHKHILAHISVSDTFATSNYCLSSPTHLFLYFNLSKSWIRVHYI